MTEEIKKSVLGSVRLDSDVWEAVRGMESSLNVYLRAALLGEDVSVVRAGGAQGKVILRTDEPSLRDEGATDPREIVPAGNVPRPNAHCVHCDKDFVGAKWATMCPKCIGRGHINRNPCLRCGSEAEAKKRASSSTAGEHVDYDPYEPA